MATIDTQREINKVANSLAVFYSNIVNQKKKIVGAISYPIVVLITALAAVLFIMKFMVPMFVEIFKRTNNELPSLTKMI